MTKTSVLIIDDDLNTIKLIAESLKQDFDIQFATSGDLGLKIASKSQPDLILLDVKLPDIQGYEVIKRLKQNPSTQDIPVMFESSLASIKEQELGFTLGAVDYITKPIEIPLLRVRIKAHAKLRQQARALEKLVATDSLTGLANRRKFDASLENEFCRSKRDGSSLCLLMIDVDYFKHYNDNYGHGKGDECLIRLSQLLLDRVHRPADLVARVGGEEFAILMPNTEIEGAINIAETIKANLRHANIEHKHSECADHVTVSIGIAQQTNDLEVFTNKDLYNDADRALYSAKEQGRNQYYIMSNIVEQSKKA